ncbi:MAG TPA: cytochrome c biogenesis protein ResB [Planctomycetota bacterium]
MILLRLVREAGNVLASLRLTVALLGMSIFLVLAGTLAQVESGIWTVVHQYFRCWFAWIDLKVFQARGSGWTLGFPFPGGFLIGTLLVINLLVSHARRIRVTARGPRLYMGLAVLAVGSLLTWISIAHVFDLDSTEKTANPTLRVTFQLVQGVGVAAVLFFGCHMVFGRKAGIVLLHGGVVLMMASEIITAFSAVETRMSIAEGESSNWAQDTRTSELAIVDPSDPKVDRVVAVPAARLRKGGAIALPDVPFDLEVGPKGYMVNADVREFRGGEGNPATAGLGMSRIAKALGEETGERIDLPALYATLKEKGTGRTLGTYLFSVLFSFDGGGAQRVEAGGKSYDLSLRFHRIYKPYEVYLKDFKFERYPGTETPKDFSSYVRLTDAERGVDRDVRIWMNNPLRYRGDTLYQADWDKATEAGTVLQVVTNVGWMVPYVGCMIVAVGLLGQFWLHLWGFLIRRRDAA